MAYDEKTAERSREAAYDRESRLSPLSQALDKAGDYGITVVSMKQLMRGRSAYLFDGHFW
jgi:hypothetical protein